MKNVIWSGVIVLSLLISAGAQAAPNMVISSDTIPEGGTASIDMVFQPDGTVTDLSFDLDYDETQFTATPSCGTPIPVGNGGSTSATCNLFDLGGGDMVVRVLVPPLFANPIPKISSPDPTIGTVSFEHIGGTGTFDLEVLNPIYFNSTDGPQVPGTASTNGQIVVQGAVYQGTPSGLDNWTVIQGQSDPMGTVLVDNVGAEGTTLTGNCTISSNPTVFSVTSGSYSVLKPVGGGATTPHTVTVSCDSDQAVTVPNPPHTGEMLCDSDGDSPDARYALSCAISEGPQPVFNSVPAPNSTIVMTAQYEGDAIPDAEIDIDNEQGQIDGDPPIVSQLNSTSACVMSGNDAGIISLTSNGTYSIPAQSGQIDTETIACDSSQWDGGSPYTATLTCPHNAQGSPAIYNIECNVGPKEPAIFDSTPAPGADTDMTPGDVKTGDTIDDQDLVLRNIVQTNGADMAIDCGFDGDPGEIEVTALGVNTLGPGEETTVTFSCDNSIAHDSMATYSCNWYSIEDLPPMDQTGNMGTTVSYDYTCEVRDAEVDVVSTPPDGSTLTEQVPSGGNAQFEVAFGVDIDEGVDGSLLGCEVDDNVNFQILSPDFSQGPVDIPAEGPPVIVTVQGNDPGGVDELATVLRCTYADSETEGEEWTYNLVMEIGSIATFRVTKNFTDDNPATVRVELHCNHGLPLIQGFNISETQHVNFVLHSFDDQVPDCSITEVSADGYKTTYHADGQSNPSYDSDGCYFDNVGRGDVNICSITNEPEMVRIDITKEWFMAGNAGNKFSEMGSVTVSSPTPIEGGTSCNKQENSFDYGNYCAYLNFYGPETDTQFVMVHPKWDGVEVGIHEEVRESYIETENDCGGSVTIFPGQGAECTVTNSVFFEGIPTLNQYGLALMALLMLGVGMVGFRRFS